MFFAQVSHWMFLTCETASALKPTNSMPICIFNHKSDLFLSAPKQSAFFAVADPGEGGLVGEVWTPPPNQT